MTAYGAVISLKNTIDYILHSSHFTLVDEPSPTIIQQTYNQLQPLQRILERLDATRTSRSRKQVNALDGRIKDFLWEFEDKLESLLYQQILPQFHVVGEMEKMLFSIDLHCLQDEVASFIKELKDMKREYIHALKNMPQEPISTTIGFDCGQSKSKMIGLSDQFQKIKNDLMREIHWMHSLQIAGMAGIGKTTLAKELYEDADIVSHFDCRAWVTVTRTMVTKRSQLTHVVQGILAQLCDGDTLIEGDQNIGDYLKGKKCLLVLDDVWEDQAIHYLLRSLRARHKDYFLYVLYTTRGIGLSRRRDRDIEVRFLNEEESKDLLCHKVFGDKDLCPDQLEKAAAKIAKKCEGLPLTIVTVADIISKSQNTEPEYWNDVAEERNPVFMDAYNEISEVLFPSYDYLPQSHKMPFLYMGVFPPDYEIPQSKLMNMLNVAGWFLDTNKEESLEGVVRECLSHCSSRHLVLLKRKSVYSGRVWFDHFSFIYKTCWLHSSWRYTCRKEARKNKFYHVLNHLLDALEEVLKGHRRLCLQNNMLFGIKEFCNSVRLNCASFTRSLLFLGPYHQYPTPIDVGFRLLRELDALQLRFYSFPTEILTLVQLKYLALTCNGEIPATISKLFNLRVLIIHPHMSIRRLRAPSYMPIQIWDMKELEHIEILGKSLRVPSHVAPLEKLLTLVGVNASISTISALSRRIPNIRKLDVRIELTPKNDHIDLLSCFAHISTLESLKILKCSIINPAMIQHGYVVPAPPSSLMFPRGLKKLHLSGMGFPWEYMDVIGSLPHLKVLKLRSYAFRGSNLEAQQMGRFPKLRFLLIEDGDLRCLNLPGMLNHVSIKHCYKLERIHWLPGFEVEGRKVEIVDCNPLAMTWAKELEPDDEYLLDVTISSSFEKEKPMITNFTRKGSDTEKEREGSDTEKESCYPSGTDDEDTDEEEDEEEDEDEDEEEEEEEEGRKMKRAIKKMKMKIGMLKKKMVGLFRSSTT